MGGDRSISGFSRLDHTIEGVSDYELGDVCRYVEGFSIIALLFV